MSLDTTSTCRKIRNLSISGFFLACFGPSALGAEAKYVTLIINRTNDGSFNEGLVVGLDLIDGWPLARVGHLNLVFAMQLGSRAILG